MKIIDRQMPGRWVFLYSNLSSSCVRDPLMGDMDSSPIAKYTTMRPWKPEDGHLEWHVTRKHPHKVRKPH